MKTALMLRCLGPAGSTLAKRSALLSLWAAFVVLALTSAGCQPAAASVQGAVLAQAGDFSSDLIAPVSQYAFATPTATPEADEETSVVISTGGARANLRSSPALDAEIVGKGNPGQSFQVVGRSEDGEWWQVCCTRGPNDDEDEATRPAWVSASVVKTQGEVEAVAVATPSAPVLPDELEAEWAVDWQCGSERCTVQQCDATVDATAEAADQEWLEVEHEVTWDQTCFSTDSWLFEVDKRSGAERTGEYQDNFLYGYWLGGNPGEINGVYTLSDDRGVAVWCSEPREVEIQEGDGWTTVYEGRTCHDINTGMLVLLTYTKRWLYSGEYDGQSYDRAYFGDSETLEQRLVRTNADLYYVDKKP